MTANIITVVAVVAGIAWLALLGVSAVRNRGSEEISPNLAPGLTNAEIETTRLESGQKAAIAFSALLAIALPLYFLGELDRQDAFVEEFATESISRGEHIVEEFACFSCHGPEGVGGSAQFVEQRSGVTVSWAAPALNDIFYRYDDDEVNFWVTFGRGNTPMPPWGIPGGGPLNELQVVDVVNYLKTIQVPQPAVLEELDPAISVQLDRLANAEDTVEAAILNQRQTIADIESAPDEFEAFAPLADRADELEERAGEGIDTDGDGISDSVETELSALTAEVAALFQKVDAIALDPEVTDAELADEAVTQLQAAVELDPILEQNLAAVETAIERGTVEASVGLAESSLEILEVVRGEADVLGVSGLPSNVETLSEAEALAAALEEASAAEDADPDLAELLATAQEAITDGSDPDGDGLSTVAEATITAQMADAAGRTIPSQVAVVDLDPANPASVGGVADAVTLNTVVGNLDSLRVTLRVATENNDTLRATEVGGLNFLLAAQERRAWEIDIEGVAEAMDVSVEEAERAVGIFNASCARCHTAGFSAGVPYTQEIGSGGFGPALWDGRPVVQFGLAPDDPELEVDLLVQFLINGSVANAPYGLNGFGSGRMPAFGAILSEADIELLAAYLRSGNLSGMTEE
ncbi:MAG: c-type cytochrome [Acidimicrobiia bacterium]